MSDSEPKGYVPMQGFGAGRLDRTVDLGTVRGRRRPPAGLIAVVLLVAIGVTVYLQWPTIGPWLSAAVEPSPVETAPAPGEPVPAKPGPAIPPGTEQATVDYVHDGDTLFLNMESGERLKVRLLGIDTPEVGDNLECFGNEARGALRDLLPEGRSVHALAVDRETDRFGRSLYYLFTDGGTNVNLELVSTGAASVLLLGDRDDYWDDLEQAETEARAADRGLWGAC